MSSLLDEEKTRRLLKQFFPSMKIIREDEFQRLCAKNNCSTVANLAGRKAWDSFRYGQVLGYYGKLLRNHGPTEKLVRLTQVNPFFGYNFQPGWVENGWWTEGFFPNEEREVFWDLVDMLPQMKEIGYKVISRLRRPYFGFHGRFESDWDPKNQGLSTPKMIEILMANGTCDKQLYIATGDLNSVNYRLFRNEVSKNGCEIKTKFDLLTGEEKKIMDNLSFDVQAQVDAVVLMSSSYFFPNGWSSFSFIVHQEAVAINRRMGLPLIKTPSPIYYQQCFTCCL
eukprot:TRINITY_DN175_c0_g3_i2.p1 TRINITY_DN175_c0_g3~~TRINITY_DN175_c0_g3_i2.p1  ORF type:complete len:282 (+),score=61.10 TRINITY_DN175_c0_g3_i2:694-1539(+)